MKENYSEINSIILLFFLPAFMGLHFCDLYIGIFIKINKKNHLAFRIFNLIIQKYGYGFQISLDV